MRKALRFCQQCFGSKPIVGAEVGVKFGDNAFDMLQNMPNLTLLCLIDPYEKYLGWNGTGYNDQISSIYEEAKTKLKQYENRTMWIRKKSEDVSNEITQPLDFMYIDGNHNYEYVMKDLNLASRTVKNGGVICGHDFNTRDFPGVVSAVIEFAKQIDAVLQWENVDRVEEKDWWIIKP